MPAVPPLTHSLYSNNFDDSDDELTHEKKVAQAEYNKNSLDVHKAADQSSKSLEDFTSPVVRADQASLSNYQNNSMDIQHASRNPEASGPTSSTVARLLQSIENCVIDDIQRDGGNPPNIVGPEYPVIGTLNTCGLYYYNAF
jgi:hypothetical protein